MATAAADGGLLLAPATDLWGDWGLLGVPDPDRATTTRQGLLFRDFIRTAFPTFQFHRLSELLRADSKSVTSVLAGAVSMG
jgi:hypothetical protein